MAELDKVTEQILEQISGGEFKQEGAYNLRQNGVSICHGDSEQAPYWMMCSVHPGK